MSTQKVRAPRCVLYARFSNAVQEGGTSIERQEQMAADYAARHGLELDTSLNLRDLGVSAFHGRNRDEGALGELLKLIGSGDIPAGSTLLIESVSRLSRMPPRKASRILEEIVEAYVTVVFLDSGQTYTLDNIDDLATDLRFRIESHAAHKLSADLQRYRRRAWQRARDRAREGKPGTRMTPGWINVPVTRDARGRTVHGKAELIRDRAAIVRRIFADYLAGVGKETIARKLNEKGVPTWGVGKRRPARWRHTYISKILVNRACIGEYQPHTTERSADGVRRNPDGPPIVNYYPPVVDTETFNRVQELLAANRPVKGSKIRTSRRPPRHLLATLLRCACGATMRRESKGLQPKSGEPKYHCEAAILSTCEASRVSVRVIEQVLCEQADDILRAMPRTDVELGEAIYELSADGVEVDQEHAFLTAQLARMTAHRQEIPRAFSEALIALEAKRDLLLAELRDRQRRYERVETRYVRQRAEHMRDMVKAYAKDPASITAANTALREVFEKVIINTKAGELTLVWRHGQPMAPPAAGTVLVYDRAAWERAHFEGDVLADPPLARRR
jgi:DNA invertase Pin-like site-specific DNA recombinase